MSTRVDLAIIVSLIVCFLTPPGFAAKKKPRLDIPPNVEMKHDVVYGLGGERKLELDLFLPKDGTKLRPGIVFIHGGGWRSGTRTQFHRQAAYLASKGYVGACITYRLSGRAKFPAALEDCKCAVRWMRANAKTYRIDTDRIAACGGSAGGHLAAMVGVVDKSHGFEGNGGHGDHSSAVQLVVDFNGVSDLDDLGKQAKLGNAIEKFLGVPYTEKPELYAKASPINYVNAKSPPMLFLHGTVDTTVPFQQSVAMVGKLRGLGIDADLYEAKDAKHGFFNRPPHFKPTLLRMEAFLDKHLRDKGKGKPRAKRR